MLPRSEIDRTINLLFGIKFSIKKDDGRYFWFEIYACLLTLLYVFSIYNLWIWVSGYFDLNNYICHVCTKILEKYIAEKSVV